MKSETKVLGLVLVLTVALLGGAIFFLGRGNNHGQVKGATEQRVVNINYDLGEKVGSSSAKIKLVEFSDFQCPACLAAEPTVDNILKTYPQDVEFVYMNFPLPQHPNGRPAATAALVAANEGKFTAMHNKLFETQDKWASLGAKEARDFFAELGKEVGVDPEKIKEAIDKDSFASKIAATTTEGNSLGVNSTPTFFVNGKRVVVVSSFNEVRSAVDQELGK